MEKNRGPFGRQRPDHATARKGVEVEAAAEHVPLRWSFAQQLEVGAAIFSDGLITEEQLGLATQHARATGTTIGYSLIHIGAITQRRLLMAIEQLDSNGYCADSMLLAPTSTPSHNHCMQLPLSPQTIEAIVQVISGGSGTSAAPSIGIYRSGPKLELFMRSCGVRMSVGGGSRMPTLTAAIEDVMDREDVDTLKRIIEAAANPSDFIDAPERLATVLEHLNRRLAFDRLALRQRGTVVELIDTESNAAVITALSTALAIIDFDTVTRDLERALESADKDPEDAVTSACSVVESVCRSILVELGTPLPAKKDVQGLYKAVRDCLALDPGGAFRADIADDVRLILSGLTSCIQGVGSLRTHGGDAHGRERGFGRHIDARIARLAIHSASAAALFLIETWQLKHPATPLKDRNS